VQVLLTAQAPPLQLKPNACPAAEIIINTPSMPCCFQQDIFEIADCLQKQHAKYNAGCKAQKTCIHRDPL
jgi:hypothetical protein